MRIKILKKHCRNLLILFFSLIFPCTFSAQAEDNSSQPIKDTPKKVVRKKVIKKVEPVTAFDFFILRATENFRFYRYNEAKADYMQVINIKPDFKEGYINLAKIYINLGEYDLAKQYLLFASGLEPKNGMEYAFLGKISRLERNSKEAILAFKKAIEVNPSEPLYYYYLGKIYLEQKNNNEAIDNFKVALKLKPEYNFINSDIGRAYEAKNRVIDAKMYYGLANEFKEINAPFYYEIANEFKRNNGIEKAIEYYNLAIKLNPDEVSYYYDLGKTYLENKQYTAAIEEYKKIVRLNPDFILPYLALGDLYKEEEMYEEALNEYNNGINALFKSSKPFDANYYESFAHDKIAFIYKKQKKYNKSITEYKKALSLYPWRTSIYIDLAEVYKLSGNNAEAEIIYQEACQLDNNGCINNKKN
jgi:tetratricopeptide (TPR) repeat protein